MTFRAIVLCLILSPIQVFAHSLSDSVLQLNFDQSSIEGYWEIAVQDLELAKGVDSNEDGIVMWGELQEKMTDIKAYAQDALQITRAGEPCGYEFGNPMLSELSSGMYLHLPIAGQCPSQGNITLRYQLLFDIDSSHRGIASITQNNTTQSILFSPSNQLLTLSTSNEPSITRYLNFIVEGAWHIWIGIDHILFLFALLIPIALGHNKHQQSVPNSRGMWSEILKVVTAFTVAHSITLILAALEIVSLPSRFVESLIALSVVLSGMNIIVPIFRGRHWQIAFGFGLIHGFGFAGVLGDLALPTSQFVTTLLSFNIGVELGQMMLVAVIVPTLMCMNKIDWVRRTAVLSAGFAITAFGAVWVAERAWDISITQWI